VRRDRPALAGYLESAAARGRGGRLELVFASEFHKSGAERFAGELKKSVASAAGRPYVLSLRVDATRPPPAVQGEPAPAEPAPAQAAELPWEDVESGAGVDEDPGVKRVLKVFQGKVRKPQKEE
jgi:hypothetical protein